MKLKRLSSLAALVAAASLAACGGTHSPAPPPTGASAPQAFVCHHRVPAQMGECIEQELRTESIAPSAPVQSQTFGAGFRSQCIDISRYQPHPDFRLLHEEGIRCVIVQSNYGESRSNPYFYSQVRSAHAAKIVVGAYVFELGESASAQAAVLESVVAPVRSLVTADAWVDAEVSGSYSEACGTVAALRARGERIVGVYGSPGTYSGGRCAGYIWPAEWGGGTPYPLSGYPASAIELRQWCGTCVLGGNSGEIDRDEDRGLLELIKPPAPTHAQLLQALYHHYKYRQELRSLISQHHCRPGEHAVPKNFHTKCAIWIKHGRRVNGEISALHAKGLKVVAPESARTPEGAKASGPVLSFTPFDSVLGAQHISEHGTRLIEGFEGFSSCPYFDFAGGVWTRGFGETSGDGDFIGPNSPCISVHEGDVRLKSLFENRYAFAIKNLHVALNQNQFDALASFVWNLGAGIFQGTTIGNELRAGEFSAASFSLLQYDRAGGAVLLGLSRRRHAEFTLFRAFAPPVETTAQHHAKLVTALHHHYRYRTSVRTYLSVHNCRKATHPLPRPKPHTRKQKRDCATVKAHGDRVNSEIAALHKKGIR